MWITLKRPSSFRFDKSQAEEHVLGILICINTELYKSTKKPSLQKLLFSWILSRQLSLYYITEMDDEQKSN